MSGVGCGRVRHTHVVVQGSAVQAKRPQELPEHCRTAGAGPGASPIPYCQIGRRSSALSVAARYAGLDVANAVGSCSHRTARGLPVEGR